jgi:hypothetical protein
MDRIHIPRTTAITAAGAGNGLICHGGAAAAIQHFPRWGLALRVPIFIFAPTRTPEKASHHSIAPFASAASSQSEHVAEERANCHSAGGFAGGICFFRWIRAKAVSRRSKIFIVL